MKTIICTYYYRRRHIYRNQKRTPSCITSDPLIYLIKSLLPIIPPLALKTPEMTLAAHSACPAGILAISAQDAVFEEVTGMYHSAHASGPPPCSPLDTCSAHFPDHHLHRCSHKAPSGWKSDMEVVDSRNAPESSWAKDCLRL